jgi:hypothetical protein
MLARAPLASAFCAEWRGDAASVFVAARRRRAAAACCTVRARRSASAAASLTPDEGPEELHQGGKHFARYAPC